MWIEKGKHAGKHVSILISDWTIRNQWNSKDVERKKMRSLNTLNTKYGLFKKGVLRFFKEHDANPDPTEILLPFLPS